MIVKRELPDHPKLYRLERALRDRGAIKYLIRIWGHCEASRKGEWWPGADVRYVEDAACWRGTRGILMKSLVDLGWISLVKEPRGVRVHDWDSVNARLLGSWRGGQVTQEKLSGKHGLAPSLAPSLAHTMPGLSLVAAPSLAQVHKAGEGIRVEGTRIEAASLPSKSFVEGSGSGAPAEPAASEAGSIPPDGEVVAFAKAFPGDAATGAPGPIPEGYLRDWIARKDSAAAGWPRNWRRALVSCWRADFRKFLERQVAQTQRMPVGGIDVRDLEAELQTETDPVRRLQLVRQLKTLTP